MALPFREMFCVYVPVQFFLNLNFCIVLIKKIVHSETAVQVL